ncbi:MAG: 2Fe-2S iron-sulfur cluster-binding protein, partial [Desulfitobacteriaceae bacterium]|nr:2Fe-2S iron-sulfur cluster-binding protein [Desulfitobacteriaceae bacterium]
MDNYSVVLLPDNKTVEVKPGTGLLEAIQKAGIPLKSTCGGQGTCGKCTVKVIEGTVSGGMGNIPAKLKEQGFILACTASVESNLKVEVPEEFRLHEHQVLLDDEGQGVLKERTLDILQGFVPGSPAQKIYLEMTPPSLVENASDYSRLITELKKHLPKTKFAISNEVLQDLPEILRAGEWGVTVTVVFQDETGEIVGLSPGKDESPVYGIAVDVGTTTVVVALVDLITGKIVAREGTYNKQAGFGDDVITRIIYAVEEQGLGELQRLVLETVNELLDKVQEEASVKPEEIVIAVVSGNTTMTHLFLGINPKYIRLEPYIPAASNYPSVKAKELGLKINPRGAVLNFPSVASYVGGDIVSGALVT